jgi:hypothetical protein
MWVAQVPTTVSLKLRHVVTEGDPDQTFEVSHYNTDFPQAHLLDVCQCILTVKYGHLRWNWLRTRPLFLT